MSLFLTNTELQELTGYKLASKQVHWLANRGYYIETNARGIPRITYKQIEDMRSIKITNNPLIALNQSHGNASEPNFNRLQHKIKKAGENG